MEKTNIIRCARTSPKHDVAAECMILEKGIARIKVLPRALRVIAPELDKSAKKPQEKAAKELPEPVSPVSQ